MLGLPSPLFAPSSIWETETARNGQITASEMGIRLHSSYNPEREAQSALSLPEVNEKSTVVFYGFGLGYHALAFAKNHPEKKLILIEPDVNHFFAALMLLDLTPVFELKELVLAIACPPDALLGLFENSLTVNLDDGGVSDAYYFDIPAFTNHAKEYFDTVKSIIKRNQRKNEINAATLKKFGKLWVNNTNRNLVQLEKCSGIGVFQKKADNNLPFLVIGAGPSLEKFLPVMKELKKRCILVCVETSLKALLRFGVEPDFILLTDPQFWAYKHIAGLKAPESFLITELSAYPAVFRFKCKNILLCRSQFPLASYYEDELGLTEENADLGSGGSVASSAWNFAYFSGAKEIYTIGLDFAFPGKQTHIKGSSAEQTYHTISTRLSGGDKFTAAALYSANAMLSKDYSGNAVLTDSRMKMFSWWFEARLAKCSDVKTFTLAPEGLKTPGIEIADIKTLLEKKECPELRKAFLLRAEEMPSCKNVKEKLSKLKKNFPYKDFLTKYPFLKNYL